MIKQIAELTLPELTLAIKKHEGDDDSVAILDGTVSLNYRKRFRIDWQTMGPLWEREADNYRKHIYNHYLFSGALAMDAHALAFKESFMASKSPESIARALLTMWYPQGIDLEAV